MEQKDWISFKFQINKWFYYHRLKAWASSRQMSVAAAIRHILTEFLKDKDIYP